VLCQFEEGKVNWDDSKSGGDFLFVVKNMSHTFSARFAKKLRKLKQKDRIRKYVSRDLIKKPWVVYVKQAFELPESGVECLDRYTHRVAISNARILKVTDTHVTFRWCKQEKGYQAETTAIPDVEFLKRFLDHMVPPHFRRIRHLGFLSCRNKKVNLELIRSSLQVKLQPKPCLTCAQVLALRWGERSELKCSECGGELLLWKVFQRKRALPHGV